MILSTGSVLWSLQSHSLDDKTDESGRRKMRQMSTVSDAQHRLSPLNSSWLICMEGVRGYR